MDKDQTKRLKAMLMIAEADIKACKAMTRIPEHINEERLRCHLNHLLNRATRH